MACRRQKAIGALALLATALLLVGCSSHADTPPPLGAPSAKESLTDLASLLTYLKEENKKPPARVEEIEPIEPLFQAAYLGLFRGEIIYIWGAGLDPSAPDKVLAYEKSAESGSGWALMQDGSLKTLPASELQSAPKATK